MPEAELRLEELDLGETRAEYMLTERQAADKSGGALGAKFRNFRRSQLEMYPVFVYSPFFFRHCFMGQMKVLGRRDGSWNVQRRGGINGSHCNNDLRGPRIQGTGALRANAVEFDDPENIVIKCLVHGQFVDPSTRELVARLVMRADTTMYIIDPAPGDAATLASADYIKAN